MFRTNRGCDADRVGPSHVGLPAPHHVEHHAKPSWRRSTSKSRPIIFTLFETEIWNRSKPAFLLASYTPGVSVFLFQTRKRWLAQLATGKEKRWVCCVEDTTKCLCRLVNKGICNACVLCFFSVFFRFVLKVCSNLTYVFSPLLFFLVVARCCLWHFVFTFPLLLILIVVRAWGNNVHACCVFCAVFFSFNLPFLTRFECCWFFFWVDCIYSLV